MSDLIQIGWVKIYDVKKGYGGNTRVYQSEGVAKRWSQGSDVLPVYVKAEELK